MTLAERVTQATIDFLHYFGTVQGNEAKFTEWIADEIDRYHRGVPNRNEIASFERAPSE